MIYMCAESNENTDFRGKHIVQTKESIRYLWNACDRIVIQSEKTKEYICMDEKVYIAIVN